METVFVNWLSICYIIDEIHIYKSKNVGSIVRMFSIFLGLNKLKKHLQKRKEKEENSILKEDTSFTTATFFNNKDGIPL